MSESEHPCEGCSKHFPDECPTYKYSGTETISIGCEALRDWISELVQDYLL